MASMRSGMPICAPPHHSGVFAVSSLRWYQCLSGWRLPYPSLSVSTSARCPFVHLFLAGDWCCVCEALNKITFRHSKSEQIWSTAVISMSFNFKVVKIKKNQHDLKLLPTNLYHSRKQLRVHRKCFNKCQCSWMYESVTTALLQLCTPHLLTQPLLLPQQHLPKLLQILEATWSLVHTCSKDWLSVSFVHPITLERVHVGSPNLATLF